MKKCLELANLGLKKTKTNPLVGCVITKNNNIISTGYHQKFGAPHAEVNAISNLIRENPINYKEILKNSTLYVNLEPCSHFGKTPPCVDLIIKHQIKHIIIGTLDPFQKVNGSGIEKLQKHGKVTVGVLEKECKKINNQYFINHYFKRPFIILKWAESSDGFINNNSKGILKISCDESAIKTHQWRSEVDGIMVGTNTIICDNPRLTTRKVKGKNPTRITIDRKSQLLHNKWNILDANAETIIFQEQHNKLKDNIKYINYLTHKIKHNSSDSEKLKEIMHILYKEGIYTLLVEGGRTIIENLITQNIWDEARIFTSQSKISEGVKGPKILAVKKSIEKRSGKDKLKIIYNNLIQEQSF